MCAPSFSRSFSKEMTSHQRVSTKISPLFLSLTKRKHKSFPPPKCRQRHDYPFPTGGSNWFSFPQTWHAADSVDGIFLNPPSNMAPVLMALSSHSSQEQRKMERKKPHWTPSFSYQVTIIVQSFQEDWINRCLHTLMLSSLEIDCPFHSLIVQYGHSASTSGPGFPGAMLLQKKNKNDLASFCSTH